ncbi:MAG: DUF5801 repeats-in-toxin domain-containing protein, partial [Notoacmeibacter sp.]
EDQRLAGEPGGLGDELETSTGGTISYNLGTGLLQSIELSVPGGDTGLRTISGATVLAVWNVASQTLIGYIAGTDPLDPANQVFTVALGAQGSTETPYTFTLLQPIQHSLNDDPSTAAIETSFEDNVSFSIEVEVTNTQASFDTATMVISIDDDTPVIALQSESELPVLVVDETVFSTDATGNFANLFTSDFGADGAGSRAYALNIVNSASGLVDVATGEAIDLVLNGGVVEGRTASTGALAFTLGVDASTGIVTLNQIRALSHPDAINPNDVIALEAELISLTATITDGDGDSQSQTIDISTAIQFLDDGPNAALAIEAPAPAMVLDESRPLGGDSVGGGFPSGRATQTLGFASQFAAPVFGADGAGNTAYAFVLAGANLASGIFALDASDTLADADGIGQGAEILLNLSGSTITGSVGGVDYFTISLDAASGAVTFTQLQPVWHPTSGPASFDETVTISLENAGSLRLVQTVTDRDFDSDTAEVNLGQGVFSIQDDGPTLTVEAASGEGLLTALAMNLDETVGDDRANASETADGNTDDNAVLPTNLGRVTTGLTGTGLASLFSVGGAFGADGAGSLAGTFSFTGFNGSVGIQTNLIATNGGTVTLFQVSPTLLEGRDGSGDLVLAIEVVTVGVAQQLQTTLFEAVVHSDQTKFDDVTTLQLQSRDEADLQIDLTYQVTRVDADGDSIVVSDSITIANRVFSIFSFDDDGPIVGPNTALTIDDDDVASANGNQGGVNDDAPSALLTGTLAHNFGSDGGTIAWLPASTSTTGGASNFTYSTSGTSLIVTQLQGGSPVVVMTVTLNAATGAYAVTQNAPLLHSSGNTENNQQFIFTYQVKDGDGDTANGTMSIS